MLQEGIKQVMNMLGKLLDREFSAKFGLDYKTNPDFVMRFAYFSGLCGILFLLILPQSIGAIVCSAFFYLTGRLHSYAMLLEEMKKNNKPIAS